MKEYSFLREGIMSSAGKFLFPNGVEKFVNYAAGGALIGSSAASAAYLAYGYTMYTDRAKTIRSLNRKINDRTISPYSRQQFIDEKNKISNMTETEYRKYAMKEFYTKGLAIGSSVGTFLGSVLSKRKIPVVK